MSLLKIGSVTEAVGENGHAVDPEQDGLPRPGHRRSEDDGDEQRDPAEDPAGERGQVRQVAGIEDDGAARPVVGAARVVARPPERVAAAERGPWAASLVGRLGRRVDPVDDRLEPAAALAVRGRRQATGKPQVPEQDEERQDERADPESERRRQAGPEDGIEADARVPQGIGPQVEPDGEQQEDADDDGDAKDEPDPAPGTGCPTRAAVIRAARSSASPRPTATGAMFVQDRRLVLIAGLVLVLGVRLSFVDGVIRRLIIVVGGGVVRFFDRMVMVGVAAFRRAGASFGGDGIRILPARKRLTLAELLHEIVEQVAHPAASIYGLAVQGRWSPSMARPKPARTVSASSFGRIAAARAGSNRNAARIARGTRHGLVSSSGGAISPSRIWSRPASSRISPESAPLTPGPRRASGGSGGGPAAGATSRKLTTPASSVTQTTASHQPSGASVGRLIPADRVRSVRRTGCSRRNDGPGGGRRSGIAAG